MKKKRSHCSRFLSNSGPHNPVVNRHGRPGSHDLSDGPSGGVMLNWTVVLILVLGSSALTTLGVYLLARYTTAFRPLGSGDSRSSSKHASEADMSATGAPPVEWR